MNDIQVSKLKRIISTNPMRNHPKITSIGTRTINHPSFAQNVTHSLETISHLNLESIINKDSKTLMCDGKKVNPLRPFKIVSNLDICANNEFSTSFRLYVASNKSHYEQQADVSQKSLLSDEALYFTLNSMLINQSIWNAQLGLDIHNFLGELNVCLPRKKTYDMISSVVYEKIRSGEAFSFSYD
ncbi:MAG: hypothetical protein VXZ40_03025 [Nanoarchaeota archaeon]|nr:hypothetical protein [Nanoarchaeota archaeon]